MKKISFVSGILILIMLVLFMTGVLDFNNSIKKAITDGNRLFAASNYGKASKVYEKALTEESDDEILNYNLGQTSYALEDYEKAIDYFAKSSTKIDRYLNSGNSSYKLADGIDDMKQKMDYLNQALETYKNGIIIFPENVEIKYNYEFVKSKIDELNKNNENKQDNNEDKQDNNQDQQDKKDDQGNSQENSQENKDSKDKQDQQDKQNSGENEDQQNQENQQSEDQNGKQDKDKQDSSSSNDKNTDNEQNGEENKDSQKDQQQDKEDDTNQDEQDNKSASGMNQKDPSDTNQTDKDIMQVLQMLEQQEESSLKNNQQVKGYGKEDEYDW
ncbi:hypothetical protein SH1V18_15730 [Vallitalea longa]|uniref:Uncharacterized protein n=1 Tax=Vallitalea longa TaxID=2936439 RepID=A0A9W5YB17_9FIRM|nr:tetratricopeptide repeat protein [Vallitalea longa]GKX29093.1 hypothetical protein SH1V18_15730 [Vallitalea longa]